jgi:hypothetical protein
MIPGPVSKVLKTIRRITGSTDDVENLATLNGVLEFLYRDENLMWLYFKETGCVSVRTFKEPCRNCRGPSKFFQSVVIPAGVKNIRELTRDGQQIRITERRVDPTCYDERRVGRLLEAEHLPPRLLEKDPDGSIVYFQSDEQSDCGAMVGVEYVDLNNNTQREDVVLGTGASGTSLSVGQFISITLPERSGHITVTNVEGAALGKYHPSLMEPKHEWYRLEWGCPGELIGYRGLREPTGLTYPTDMVPFSDQTLWRLALKAYEFLDAMELTPGQSNGLARIFSQLAAVGVADAKSADQNFNITLLPDTSRAALGTGRRFSGQTPQLTRRW